MLTDFTQVCETQEAALRETWFLCLVQPLQPHRELFLVLARWVSTARRPEVAAVFPTPEGGPR